MPRIVDREERRTEILQRHVDLVRRVGLGQASSRALAKEAGMAAGALWNYFDGIDEVVLESYRLSFTELNGRIDAISASDRGLTAISKIIVELLPMNEQTEAEAQVIVAYMNNSERFPGLITVQQEMEERWLSSLRRHLAEAAAERALSPLASTDDLGELLLVLLMGLQMESLLPNANTAGPQRQWELIELGMSPWLMPGARLPRPQYVQQTAD